MTDPHPQPPFDSPTPSNAALPSTLSADEVFSFHIFVFPNGLIVQTPDGKQTVFEATTSAAQHIESFIDEHASP